MDNTTDHTPSEGAYVTGGRYVYFNKCSCEWTGSDHALPGDMTDWNAHIAETRKGAAA